jgi:tRNA(Ile)-lysidine synthase
MPDQPNPQHELGESFRAALRKAGSPSSLCVAYSGGRDSTVLLHVASQQSEFPLRAVYVNHGLHLGADSWGAHCGLICKQLGVPFSVLEVTVNPSHAQGPESAARDARYEALHANLLADEALLTAHHEQDQLETFLLQLFRGAGVAGLAGMPVAQRREGVMHLRPLLNVPAQSVADYARAMGLEWIEDPSNEERQFDRNFVRHELLPLIQERWPAAARAVARTARLSGYANELLEELARIDLDGAVEGRCLSAEALSSRSRNRQRNLLRYCLRQWHLPVPSEAQLNQALSSLLSPRADSQPEAAWPGVRIRRFRGRLWFFGEINDPLLSVAGAPQEYLLEPGSSLDMGPVRGRLDFGDAEGAGIAHRWLQQPLEIRFREGGEKLRPARNAATRSLKNLLQESDIVPWMRGHIPLIYADEQLVAVGDLWINAACAADPGEPGHRVNWTGHAPIR